MNWLYLAFKIWYHHFKATLKIHLQQPEVHVIIKCWRQRTQCIGEDEIGELCHGLWHSSTFFHRDFSFQRYFSTSTALKINRRKEYEYDCGRLRAALLLLLFHVRLPESPQTQSDHRNYCSSKSFCNVLHSNIQMYFFQAVFYTYLNFFAGIWSHFFFLNVFRKTLKMCYPAFCIQWTTNAIKFSHFLEFKFFSKWD